MPKPCKRVREDMGLTNVEMMIPFVRTAGAGRARDRPAGRPWPEARRERPEADHDVRSARPTPCWPTSSWRYFDGFSIGSNDLTQLTLGLDRDSGLELLANRFDERDPAVKKMLAMRHLGLPGQGQVHRYLRPGPIRPP